MAETKEETAKESAAKPKAPPRLTAEAVVRKWAEGLTPQNAPPAKDLGPLAWVRGRQVERLIEQLQKEGYR